MFNKVQHLLLTSGKSHLFQYASQVLLTAAQEVI